MNYQEFKAAADKIMADIPTHIYGYTPPDDTLWHAYETGGISGGSCWEDSYPQRYSNTPTQAEQALKQLTPFLVEVASSLTYLQSLTILGMVKEEDYTDYEYYGNCVDYKVLSVDLKMMHNSLTDMGCLAGAP